MPRGFRFKTPEDLQERVEQYLEICKAEERPLTMAGLAVYLGMARQSLWKYADGSYDKDRAEGELTHAEVLAWARTVIEADKNEKALCGKYNATVAIFDLKNNHGWKDQTHTDVTTGGS